MGFVSVSDYHEAQFERSCFMGYAKKVKDQFQHGLCL